MTNAKSNIFCPNCSANNKIEQNFCRFCGLNLLETARSLRAQFSSEPREERRFKKLELVKKVSDFSVISFAFAAAAGLLIYAYSDWAQTLPFSRRVFLLVLVAAFFTLQAWLNYYRRKNTVGYWEELAVKKAALPEELTTRETAKLLEDKPFETVLSITENSTRLLYVENKTKKLE